MHFSGCSKSKGTVRKFDILEYKSVTLTYALWFTCIMNCHNYDVMEIEHQVFNIIKILFIHQRMISFHFIEFIKVNLYMKVPVLIFVKIVPAMVM